MKRGEVGVERVSTVLQVVTLMIFRNQGGIPGLGMKFAGCEAVLVPGRAIVYGRVQGVLYRATLWRTYRSVKSHTYCHALSVYSLRFNSADVAAFRLLSSRRGMQHEGPTNRNHESHLSGCF